MSERYEDIIHLPRHVSSRRLPMPLTDRAAQFSPFAALTGYEDTIRETGRLTDAAAELACDEQELLNRQLQELARLLPGRPEITVTHFVPDTRKSGGAYVETTGRLLKIDSLRQILVLEEGREISFGRICGICWE